MHVRKNYRSLTAEERDRFVEGLNHVKENGTVDRFADLHAEHFSHGIHRSSHFLPWHREHLLRFEAALRVFHPEIAIPYWDSTLDQSPSVPLWRDDFLGQFDAAWNLNRVLGADTLPSARDVERNRERDSYGSFWPELEVDIHNPPHRWVGGEMARPHSPRDPVFYLHHCWIDLLWVLWQRAHPDAPFEASRPGLGLDDPLMEWPDRTPQDVLDHRALGYRYDTEDVGLILALEGRLLFLRAHDVGTGFGPPGDHIDVEVVVRLDSAPERALGFQLRRDADEAARRGMLDTLRGAFNVDRRVRLDFKVTGANNGVLLRAAQLPESAIT